MTNKPELTIEQRTRHVAEVLSDQLDQLEAAGEPDDALLAGGAMAMAERVERKLGKHAVAPWFRAQAQLAATMAGPKN